MKEKGDIPSAKVKDLNNIKVKKLFRLTMLSITYACSEHHNMIAFISNIEKRLTIQLWWQIKWYLILLIYTSVGPAKYGQKLAT